MPRASGFNTVHDIPNGDAVRHESTPDCSCGPTAELVPTRDGGDGWRYVHHSLDGREKAE